MKYLIQIIMVLLIPFSAVTQSLIGGYNSTASGHSLSIDYNINRKQIDFGFGIGINLPARYLDRGINEYYYKKLFPVETQEFFALKTYLHRSIFDKTNIEAFVFYDFQLRRSRARTQTYYAYNYDSSLVVNRPEDGIIYLEQIDEYGPYFWLENTVGIGMDISITEKFYIRQKFGLGVTMIYGYDKGNVIVNISGRDHIYGFLAHFGVGYKLK